MMIVDVYYWWNSYIVINNYEEQSIIIESRKLITKKIINRIISNNPKWMARSDNLLNYLRILGKNNDIRFIGTYKIIK